MADTTRKRNTILKKWIECELSKAVTFYSCKEIITRKGCYCAKDCLDSADVYTLERIEKYQNCKLQFPQPDY